ncbi:hypothetical protein BCR44DRAFT_66383 [Catenaria anguillulae PL171]|uniref:Uncharacterized protein n=1 Tax=Catenaria anguillulae PL171 TaxID=765915 RepID=A0A1Y2GZ32_9FUNG|nr:hypothetical protein BCR44DRAFT_66383 [Catenaria anguillulae PL171]
MGNCHPGRRQCRHCSLAQAEAVRSQEPVAAPSQRKNALAATLGTQLPKPIDQPPSTASYETVVNALAPSMGQSPMSPAFHSCLSTTHAAALLHVSTSAAHPGHHPASPCLLRYPFRIITQRQGAQPSQIRPCRIHLQSLLLWRWTSKLQTPRTHPTTTGASYTKIHATMRPPPPPPARPQQWPSDSPAQTARAAPSTPQVPPPTTSIPLTPSSSNPLPPQPRSCVSAAILATKANAILAKSGRATLTAWCGVDVEDYAQLVLAHPHSSAQPVRVVSFQANDTSNTLVISCFGCDMTLSFSAVAVEDIDSLPEAKKHGALVKILVAVFNGPPCTGIYKGPQYSHLSTGGDSKGRAIASCNFLDPTPCPWPSLHHPVSGINGLLEGHQSHVSRGLRCKR